VSALPVGHTGPPLHGVRVLDLTRLLPGAYATLLLADLGADVIKVEDPRGGDGMRRLAARLPPPRDALRRPGKPSRSSEPDAVSFFDLLNRNKRSITLDLRSPDAAAVLDALAARSDVIVDSFRPSTALRLKVDGETLLARHPRLICASISGFGHRGPNVERAAHDINYQALAGLLRPPELPGPLIGDIGAAMHAAIEILGALIARQQTGAGRIVDVSIHGAATQWSMFPTTADLMSACYTIYETADGQWLALGALEPKFWRGFCERIGRSDLITQQYAGGDEGARVVREVGTIMRSRTRDEWLAHFADADVCLTTVLTPAQASAPPPAVRLKADATYDRKRAPELGADTDALLEEAGIGAVERSRLRAARVI
jgi:alpha-methylacyl-CoA racemase